jgi:hypothetical protein
MAYVAITTPKYKTPRNQARLRSAASDRCSKRRHPASGISAGSLSVYPGVARRSDPGRREEKPVFEAPDAGRWIDNPSISNSILFSLVSKLIIIIQHRYSQEQPRGFTNRCSERRVNGLTERQIILFILYYIILYYISIYYLFYFILYYFILHPNAAGCLLQFPLRRRIVATLCDLH